ncbi:MAG: regulatory protein RecX [Nitrospirota bacterium]
MKSDDPVKMALNYAYRLLSYRSRSEKELIDKLNTKGFDEGISNKVLRQLRSSGLIDDARLASSLSRLAAEYKHLGASGTRRFLADRGIPRGIITEAVKEIDEFETAGRLIQKKLRLMRDLPENMVIRKLYGILMRKGYSYEIIKKALRDMDLSMPDSITAEH